MSSTMELLPALLMGLVGLYAVCRGCNVYDALLRGAGEGLGVLLRILPALVALLPAAAMLRASGALEALTALIAPLLRLLGLPEECTLLMLLRPLSGSAALSQGAAILESCGADSLAGRTAAVMLGSTETTFYVLSVYFSAAGVKKSRHALPAALCADAVGFLAAAWWVRFFFA